MTVALFILLIILSAIAFVVLKGGKGLRAAVAYLIWYCVARILDNSLFGGQVSDFIRRAIQAVINAFQGIFNPEDIGALVVSAIVIGVLVWLLLKGGKLRDIIAFALAYVLLRFIEVGLFGNGFGPFMRGVFMNISQAFASGAAGL